MDLTGSYTIPAKQSAVWAALNDPNILKECIPGCETLIPITAIGFKAKVQGVSRALPRVVRASISREQGTAPC